MTRTITRQQLSSLLRDPNVILFEALPESHWAAGHLPGAVAMPLERVTEIAARHAPDRSTTIVVYCASSTCQSSHVAAAELASLGYESVSVYPGG